MFKVGDKVWSVNNGWGTVTEMRDYNAMCPVVVKYYCSECTNYTKDGKLYKDINRSLFFEEILIPETALVRPKWRAEQGCNYFFVTSTGRIDGAFGDRDDKENRRFNIGNYFRSIKEAEKSKFYKVFHEGVE